MADFEEMMGAVHETDHALGNLQSATGKAEDGGSHVAVVLGLGLEAIAMAVREAGVRADYVTRDERVRASR